MAEDYSSILKPIRRLIFSGCSAHFVNGDVLQKHIYSFSDIEKRYSVLKKDTEKKIDRLETLASKVKLSGCEKDENPVEKEVADNIIAQETVVIFPDPIYEAKIAITHWQALTKDIILLIEEGNGQKVLDSLQIASKLGCVCKKFLVLCLVLLTKQTSDKTIVTKAYSAVPEICSSSTLFLLFLQINKIFSKACKTNGWGRGLRRAVHNWYIQWNPMLLALEVSRFPSAYTWNHRDVIKLAHLKLKDLPIGTQSVLQYIFSNFESTKNNFSNDPSAAEYLSLLEILQVEKNDVTNTDKMIERGKFILKEFNSIALVDFSTQILNETKVLEFLLSNGCPLLIVQLLAKTSLFKVSNSNKEIGSLLLSTIQKDGFVRNIETLDILIAYNACRRAAVTLLDEGEKQKVKWMKNAKPTSEKSVKVTVPKIPKEESVTIIEALGTLLVKATELYHETEKTAVIFIDTSPSLKNYINVSENRSSSKEIKGIQAISYIMLSLASNNRFNLVYPVFFSGTGLEKPSMPKPCSFHFLQTKLKNIAISTVKVKEGLDYACLHKLDTCIMLCYKITTEIANLAQQSIIDIKTKDSSCQIRLIVCGICPPDEESDDTIPATIDCHPDLLIISGFNRNSLCAISAFHERIF